MPFRARRRPSGCLLRPDHAPALAARRLLALLAVLGLAACLPGQRDEAGLLPDGPDGVDVLGDAQGDAAGDAGLDAAAADGLADAATVDTDDGDADATDDAAADAEDTGDTGDADDAADAGADATPVAADATLGCTSDAQCAGLPLGPCRTGVCNLATGLCKAQELADGTTCDAGPCVQAAACKAGACVGKLNLCDDGDVCTDDSCDPVQGCATAYNSLPCDDGDACTVGDVCAVGICVPGAPMACDECSVCNGGACKGAPGKIGAPCTSDQGCPSTCNGSGECPLQNQCRDGNPCTYGFCQVGLGTCQQLPVLGLPLPNEVTPCGDGKCQTGACAAGAKCQVTPKCDDKNPCTTDSCNTATGACTFAEALPDAVTSCDDGDPCTTAEACTKKQCKGKPLVCEDGNACTEDSCLAGQGCIAKPKAGTCSDGLGCTTGDTCTGGVCQGVPACDDANACTADTCGAKGCSHAAVSDATPCGTGMTCVQGVCKAP